MSTVYQHMTEAVTRYRERPFLHIPAVAAAYHDGDIDLSYEQLGSKVELLKECYRQAGYGQGHRIALLLENRQDFFLHWFALNGLGASVVPINGDMQTDEIAYLLEDSEACLGIALASRCAQLTTAASRFNSNFPVLDCNRLESLSGAATQALSQFGSASTECALLYTSGSTGKPKGCILSNEYFTEFGAWYCRSKGIIQLEPGRERLLTPLPLVHMNAMAVSTMGMLMSGGCIIQLDRFSPSSWWQSVAESRATMVHYLGVLPAILLQLEPSSYEKNLQVKFGFGAGVNPLHHQNFEQRFGFPLVESWAMSESGSGGCITANQEPRHVGSCCFGQLPENVEIKLIDEAGNEVPTGEPGELLVRAKGDKPRRGFFSGYYKNPSATAEAWQGGYLNTGDVVRQSDDGSLHFVDRRKNVIRRSGENISALEVEAAMSQQQVVEQLAVCAVPDEIRGDEVMALIVLPPGLSASATTATDIVNQARQSLSYYKVPAYIAFVSALPMTASNKPQRGEIKKLAAKLLARGECIDLCHLKKGSKR